MDAAGAPWLSVDKDGLRDYFKDSREHSDGTQTAEGTLGSGSFSGRCPRCLGGLGLRAPCLWVLPLKFPDFPEWPARIEELPHLLRQALTALPWAEPQSITTKFGFNWVRQLVLTPVDFWELWVGHKADLKKSRLQFQTGQGPGLDRNLILLR